MTDRHGRVTRDEWRWTLLVGVVLVTVISIPYGLGWSRQTPERIFSGCLVLIEDCHSYLAKMRQGAEGAWLFHISHSPERHSGSLFYILHLLLGKIARLLPGDDLTTEIVLVYHLARVVFGLGFLLMVYRFLAALTRKIPTRRLAWSMVAAGGGIGWLLTALGRMPWLGDVPLDLYFPEGFAFITILGFPHVAAAQTCLLGGLLCLLRAWDRRMLDGHQAREGSVSTAMTLGRRRTPPFVWAAVAGILWFLMGLIIPFYVAIVWALTGVTWGALCLRRGFAAPAVHLRTALLASVAVVVSAPVLVYAAYVFTSDPVYAAWAAQKEISSPHPLHFLAAYGAPLVLAVPAFKETWYEDGWAWVTVCWVALVPFLVYLPVNPQLRLTTGVQVPLSVLAARGAARHWEQKRRGTVLVLLTLMIGTIIFTLVTSTAWITSRPPQLFRDADEVAALDWLAVRAEPGDAVLTAYETGAYLPVRVNARVLVGHDLEATNAGAKRDQVARFFDASTGHEWRQEMLADYGVDYVFWGPAERSLGGFDPGTASYLRPAYAVGEYTVFVVELPG